MIFTSPNNLYKNNIAFNANIIIKNPEVKQLMQICKDKEYTKMVLDEFSKIEPEQTIEINIKQISDNLRQLIAKNINNGMECKNFPFKNSPHYIFYDFLESLVTRSVNKDKFWHK